MCADGCVKVRVFEQRGRALDREVEDNEGRPLSGAAHGFGLTAPTLLAARIVGDATWPSAMTRAEAIILRWTESVMTSEMQWAGL